ncbi:NAD(P)/FAD-dependent oxidoreductase [Kitasatospora sp. NPDC096147]|uniref:NAD(P)/FAD-dependent oxidoreductase n=1 Tax=Kitasatospora sp. NPDC096147 TaxID=3364093 RepID=UPI0037FE11B0
MTGALRRVLVVGASLAGLRAADRLRAGGFDGELTVVGAEPHLPYDRPPLSKRQLATDDPAESTTLRLPDGLGARWLTGVPAVGLDPDGRTVKLADGQELGWDGLVIATGAAARGWHGPVPAGVHTLRGRDDAVALRAGLRAGRRLVVVGAGFLGGEIAATARACGLEVTLVEAAEQPLARAVGAEAGGYLAELHRESGIVLRTGVTVTAFHGEPGLTGVTLSDGTELPADLAVLALGAVPHTGWLAGAGLAPDGGLDCDPYLRALRADGSVLPGVVAAGDVVRWPHPLAGGARVTLGHWSNAVEQAATAAHTLLHPDEPQPFTGVPSFWSDLHGVKLHSVGLPAFADRAEVLEHDLPGRRLEIAYHRAGRLVGALTVNRVGRLAGYRRELHEALLR